VADGARLLIECTGQTVPGVRIPSSPFLIPRLFLQQLALLTDFRFGSSTDNAVERFVWFFNS
jgi:hypothetical protein